MHSCLLTPAQPHQDWEQCAAQSRMHCTQGTMLTCWPTAFSIKTRTLHRAGVTRSQYCVIATEIINTVIWLEINKCILQSSLKPKLLNTPLQISKDPHDLLLLLQLHSLFRTHAIRSAYNQTRYHIFTWERVLQFWIRTFEGLGITFF